MATDEFGGVLVEQETDEFGGIPVMDPSGSRQPAFITPAELRSQTRAGVGIAPTSPAPTTLQTILPFIAPPAAPFLSALTSTPAQREAIARGLLGGGTAGLTEALGQRLTKEFPTAESPEFQFPYTTAISEAIGGIAPTGRLVQGAQTLRQLARLGAEAGGAYGGAAGLASALEGEAPIDFGEALTSALGGATAGALGGALFGVVPGVGARLAERFARTQIRRDVPSLVTDVLNPTGNVAKRRLDKAIETGRIDETIGIIKRETKGSPRDIEGGLSAVEKTKENLGNQINEFSERNKDLKISSAEAAQQVRSVLDSPEARILLETDPQLAASVEARAKNLEALELTPKSLFDRLKGYNSLEKNYLQKSTAGIATPADDILHDAIIAERDALSDLGDRTIRGITGKDENFYRKYGQVSEFGNNLEQRRINLVTQRRGEVGRGILSGATQADIGRPVGALSRLFSPLTGGELERVNQNVRRLFQRVPESTSPSELTQAQRAELLGGIGDFPPANQPSLSVAEQITGISGIQKPQELSPRVSMDYTQFIEGPDLPSITPPILGTSASVNVGGSQFPVKVVGNAGMSVIIEFPSGVQKIIRPQHLGPPL